MLTYTIRRLLFAIPTLLVISFIIFALLDLSPGDPTANLPMTIGRDGNMSSPITPVVMTKVTVKP